MSTTSAEIISIASLVIALFSIVWNIVFGYTKMMTKIEVIQNDINWMKTEFEEIDKRFEGIDKRFEKMDARFDKTDEKLDAISQDMHKMDVRVNTLEQQKP